MSHPIAKYGRIQKHGKITDLSEDFVRPCGFSLFFVPIGGQDDIVVAEVILKNDTEASNCPFVVGQWNEPLVTTLKANSGLLEDYDIYWGC